MNNECLNIEDYLFDGEVIINSVNAKIEIKSEKYEDKYIFKENKKETVVRNIIGTVFFTTTSFIFLGINLDKKGELSYKTSLESIKCDSVIIIKGKNIFIKAKENTNNSDFNITIIDDNYKNFINYLILYFNIK